MALQHHPSLFDSISYILNFLPLPRPYFHLLIVLSDVTHLFMIFADKSAKTLANSPIANPQISRLASPPIFINNPNSQIFKKILPTLSPNSHRSRLLKRFFLFLYKFQSDHYLLFCKEKKYLFADLQKFQVPKSQKDWVCKSQPQSCTFAEGPQICGFLICRNYLRTAHLCFLMNIMPTYTYIVDFRK
jgi:hypothetical protein